MFMWTQNYQLWPCPP
uniref:Uncharacterized protein n=1 Tax=Rhizophora mucronata TaxID=61149 RepID=A0A2P2QQ77_RHIMU